MVDRQKIQTRREFYLRGPNHKKQGVEQFEKQFHKIQSLFFTGT
jgi:hypothetical protein